MSKALATIDEQYPIDDYIAIAGYREKSCTMSKIDAWLDWVIFPVLLFVQFGMAMYCQNVYNYQEQDWVIVFLTILGFSLIAAHYRKVLRSHPRRCLLTLLFPEIFTNILLALVMFGKLTVAFDALVALATLLLLLTASVKAHLHYFRIASSPHDYQQLNGRLDEAIDDCESGH